MSEEVTTEVTTLDSKVAQLKELILVVEDNASKGIAGNKQAARRARIALNSIKKICTPLRVELQEAVAKKKA